MRRSFFIMLDAYWRFIEDDGWAIASHIALSALMSVFPFLIFVTALAGFIGFGNLADEVESILFESWPNAAAEPIKVEIHSVLSQSRRDILTLGVLLAIWFSSNGIEALRIGLNRAYDMKENRAWWLLRLESMAYVLIGALALLALAFLVVLGPLLWSFAVRYFPDLLPFSRLVTLIRLGAATLVIIVALVIAHAWLPSGRRSLRRIAPGVAVTLVLMLACGLLFGNYLARFSGNYVTTYAGLASVMIALVFLYAISAIFIYGAELNTAISEALSDTDN
jgi:membrane protein